MGKLFELTDPHLHYLYHVCEAIFIPVPLALEWFWGWQMLSVLNHPESFFNIIKIDYVMPEWFLF